MTKTKKSMLMSTISLLLCISMLIGSTFAWFTDSVTSAGNKIQSGTLKVDLELLDKETNEWKSLKETQAPIFNYDKWEPGYMDIKVFKVENEGNLALTWVAKFYSEEQLSILADVIDVYVYPSNSEIGYPTDCSLENYTCVGNLRTFINSIEETTWGILDAKETSYLGIALKMREEAGNEYQNLSLGGAFDIRIYATQYTSEWDSFDNQYDKDATFDVLADPNILTSQAKYINNGAETVDFSIIYKGVKIVGVSVPEDAIADKSKPVKVTISAIDPYIDVTENSQTYAYDIQVTNLKSDLAEDQMVTVVIGAPKGLASMKVYHKDELVEDAVYDEVAGTITFRTANFSPFSFTTAVYEVDDLASLRDILENEDKCDGAYIKLAKDIEINLSKGSSDRSEKHVFISGSSTYYNAVNIVGKDVAIDLNGNSITLYCGHGNTDNSDVGALFYVGSNGSLNILDDIGGGFIKMRSSVYAVWAPYAEPSYVDIFGGAFIADSYAGDPLGTALDSNGNYDPVNGTMKDENSNRALVYAGTGGNINVYGGYFLYNNTPNDSLDRNNGAFNAKDHYKGGPLITIHEGVYLSNKEYRQDPLNTSTPNGTYDNESVVLEDDNLYKVSQVKLDNPIEIDGEEYAEWFVVTRNFKYIITFKNSDGTQVLDTKYIWEDDGKVTLSVDYKDQNYIDKDAKSKLTGEYIDYFAGWANAASKKVTEIAETNTKDIVLYPTLENKVTVRWLNEDGVVLESVQVKSGSQYSTVASSEPDDPLSKYGDVMKFSHWEIRRVNSNGTVVAEELSNTYKITSDISIYPVYDYNGEINLTPHDTDGDGRPDYYTVESATGLSGEVTIPGDVNGIPVAIITDLSGDWVNSGVTSIIVKEGVREIGSNAFAMTSGLKKVEIPASMETIGANAFANTIGGALISKTITIKYAGTWEEFQAICEEDWERGLATGTKVECSDGTATLKATEYVWYWDYYWTFVKK